MIPWTGRRPLTSATIEVFNGLRGKAREQAIATGHYDELVKREAEREPEREPGQDDDPLDDPFARAMGEEPTA